MMMNNVDTNRYLNFTYPLFAVVENFFGDDIKGREIMIGKKRFDEWLNNSSNKHIKFGNNDVEGLYWLAAAYGGAVSSSRGDPEWVIQLLYILPLYNNK